MTLRAKISTQGKCPKCGADLDYGLMEAGEGEDVFYHVTCHRKPCGFIGREWYNIEFSEITED